MMAGMLADWDLWPWMIADQAGGILGVHKYRMERSILRVQRAIGERLLPAFRKVGVSALDAVVAFRALADVLPWDPDALTKVSRR